MSDHYYLESGWCICGHHRDDGRKATKLTIHPTLAEIRAIRAENLKEKPE